MEEAGPSTPVEITGLDDVPEAGDVLNAVEDERLAKELVEQRKHEQKEAQFSAYEKVTLDNLFSHISQGDVKSCHHCQGRCAGLGRGRQAVA